MPTTHTPQLPERFRVTWEIDSDAATPQEAAQAAWDAMRRPDSIANVCAVVGRDGCTYTVDLHEDQDEAPAIDGALLLLEQAIAAAPIHPAGATVALPLIDAQALRGAILQLLAAAEAELDADDDNGHARQQLGDAVARMRKVAS